VNCILSSNLNLIFKINMHLTQKNWRRYVKVDTGTKTTGALANIARTTRNGVFER
jgi:hypothetical protein